MASEIHQDDIGTRFLVTVKDDGVVVDISSASLRELTFRKPSDETVTRTASIIGDGSSESGVMYYDSIAGDLDELGNYKIQGQVALTNGTYYTDIATFLVNCNL